MALGKNQAIAHPATILKKFYRHKASLSTQHQSTRAGLFVKNDLNQNNLVEHKPNSIEQGEIEMNTKNQDPLFSSYPDVMGVKQVQTALGIGRIGAYKLLESGAIQNFKIGNAYKVPKTALLKYISQNCPNITEGE